jgi:threonine dehydrogenase-like Zn-dependent dehydrogenase
MPQTGLVAAMTGVKKPFILQEYPLPDPEPGAILVKITQANICGSDLHLWKGGYIPADPGRPDLRSVGHEMCGLVEKLGDGVTADSAGQPLREGDRIAYRYFVACGRCRACMRGFTPRCPYGMRYRHPPDVWPHFNAAYGQYYYLRPGQAVFKIPEGVPDDLAAPANCALAQVVYTLYLARVGLGDHVVIQGAGGLGVLAAAVAKERGAASVTVIDSLDDRLALAKEFGADHLIDMKRHAAPADRIARVKQLTDGWGADVVVELVGRAAAVPEGVAMLGNGGTYAMVGCICENDFCRFDPSSLVLPGRNVLGIMWYDAPSLLFALQFLARFKDKYPFHRLVSHRYPLSAINEAMAAQDAGKAQRSALLPWA